MTGYLNIENECRHCGKELRHEAHTASHKYCSKKCKRKAYYIANRELEINRSKEYRLANREKVLEYKRKWREKNRKPSDKKELRKKNIECTKTPNNTTQAKIYSTNKCDYCDIPEGSAYCKTCKIGKGRKLSALC